MQVVPESILGRTGAVCGNCKTQISRKCCLPRGCEFRSRLLSAFCLDLSLLLHRCLRPDLNAPAKQPALEASAAAAMSAKMALAPEGAAAEGRLDHQLNLFRRGAPPGSVQDIHRKHLLALLMRRDPSVWSLVPRSYILTRDPADAASEWKIFKRDFELSQCLGRLRNFLEAQAASTPKPSEDDGLESTLDICKKHLEAHIEDNEFWEGLHLSPMRKAEMLVRRVEQELPHLQLDLLQNNWWLAKPVDGAMGKGIILFGGLSCAEDLQISTMPFSGRMSDGYVLQKYIEKPHLVHMPSLIDIDNRRGRHTAGACVDEFYKYNLRMLVLVRWVEDPSVWVYDQGYIDLCAMPFAEEYGAGVQEAHVSNLPCKGKGIGVRKRMWSTDTFRQYLQECAGRDVWAEEIVSQIRTAISRALSCLLPLTTGPGCSTRDDFNSTPPVRQPWRRFGFDFALGTNFHVWLVEVNHRPGMKAPKGPAGEDKRQLLESLLPRFLGGAGSESSLSGLSRR
ncbi:TTLL3A [Symbiodinium sp. CCMP2456]|nr:TTLL3A [Symbiodinium sp. CCMP2456]